MTTMFEYGRATTDVLKVKEKSNNIPFYNKTNTL